MGTTQIIASGIGFNPGAVSWIPTRGFYSFQAPPLVPIVDLPALPRTSLLYALPRTTKLYGKPL